MNVFVMRHDWLFLNGKWPVQVGLLSDAEAHARLSHFAVLRLVEGHADSGWAESLHHANVLPATLSCIQRDLL